MKYLAVCLLVVAGSCLADLSRRNTYGSYYDKLADELKVPFLRYQLAVAVVEVGANSEDKSYPVANHLLTPEGLGLPDTVFSSLEELDTPAGFSSHLFSLVTKDMGLNVYHVIDLIRTSFACPDKNSGCWDIGDVGSNCC
ncbi:uncharacterized protein LOC110836659 [Zootermopsis nevadensis]|uniref:Uncharacterized protein n=1 Tax=Zootermopsis nevadensis TaxID=136037 RepID=A0A067QQ83_ZOONE|nr:uncharacterized protein LOC110836659 [Zootermopsis nevadensis]XP_021933774.1 uncharacterized protein LOC110836659 [Zootermopsis nevadensis]KDR11926.1 hypothetical protein L798_14205 [Zootermopsis nevadensis]